MFSDQIGYILIENFPWYIQDYVSCCIKRLTSEFKQNAYGSLHALVSKRPDCISQEDEYVQFMLNLSLYNSHIFDDTEDSESTHYIIAGLDSIFGFTNNALVLSKVNELCEFLARLLSHSFEVRYVATFVVDSLFDFCALKNLDCTALIEKYFVNTYEPAKTMVCPRG